MTALERLTADIIYNVKTHKIIYEAVLAELLANIFEISIFLAGDRQISDLLLLAFIGHVLIYGSIGLAAGICTKTGSKLLFKVVLFIVRFIKSIYDFPSNVRKILKQKEANN